MAPALRYTEVNGAEVAYQVLGDGPVAYLGTPGLAQNIEILWEEPFAARFLRRHASFSKFIWFDKRGTGLSAREMPTSFAERIDDMRAVLDAERVERAFIGGYSDGGTMSALFAAAYPERTAGLALATTTAAWTWREDMPWQPTTERWAAAGAEWARRWGTGSMTVERLAPSMVSNPDYVRWMGRYERQSLTPKRFTDLWALQGEIDLRAVLPTIAVPTLILHRADETGVDVRNARYLREKIPGARLVLLEGRDHLPWIGDQDSFMDEVEEFVTGTRHVNTHERVLATVLFTDIVDSTAHAARLGDNQWRRLLEEHDITSTHLVEKHGGRVVKGTGDGVVALFELPSRAVHCALELEQSLKDRGIELRAGAHAGEVERRGDDIAGLAVHIAARIAALAAGCEVLVSGTVKDLSVGSTLKFEERGLRHLKGLEDEMAVHRAVAAHP